MVLLYIQLIDKRSSARSSPEVAYQPTSKKLEVELQADNTNFIQIKNAEAIRNIQ